MRIVEYLLVEPRVQVRIFDLELQAEKYALYHRRAPSRIIHALCIAPNVGGWLLAASGVSLGGMNLAPVAALALFVGYLAMERAVGLALLPFLLAGWAS